MKMLGRNSDELQPENREEFNKHIREANEDIEMEDEQVRWYSFSIFDWFGDEENCKR